MPDLTSLALHQVGALQSVRLNAAAVRPTKQPVALAATP